MICYFEYGTAGVNLNLVSSEISVEEINPGAFATTDQELTQTIIKVAINGRPNIYATTQTIGDMITQCQTSEGRSIGSKVYLKYQPAGQDTVYRARCRSIAFVPEPTAGQYWKVQRHVRGEFIAIHEMWEGELTQIPLTNTHGTDDTSGLQIDNTTDATHDNTAWINDEDIDGDAPAPAMICLTNTYNAAVYPEEVFIGLNINSDPANFDHVLEAEDAIGSAGDVVDALSSAGKYTRIATLTSIHWNLSANDVVYANGNQFHILVRLGPAAGAEVDECYMYFRLGHAAVGAMIWSSDPIYLIPSSGTYGVENACVVRIPPWRVSDAKLSSQLFLGLYLYSITGAAKNADIDAVYLYPVDGYRVLQEFGGLQIGVNSRVIDDEIEDELYADDGAGTVQYHDLVALGSRILLQPGRNQKLYFLTTQSTGQPGVLRTWSLKLYYRPRRLAL